ncbi:CAP domain-containing protein [Streptomyces sp. NPDC048566]|uniref:CAP domain-containing protein n=1 Tax=Streptomyces sp. NPDC048566 TaxID=3365569 RepID=UPI0037183C65
MSELVPGGNTPLPGGVLSLTVPGPFDVSALVTDTDGRVRGDADFVFYNQTAAPGVRLDGDRLRVDPARLRPGADRVTVVVSPAEPGTPLGRLPSPALLVSTADGREVARFTPPRPQAETVLLLAELYRRGPAWKLRALGQGYADGLAGVARDFGIEVTEDAEAGPPAPGTPPAARRPADAVGAAAPGGRTPTLPDLGPIAAGGGPPPADRSDPREFLHAVNSARAAAGSPPVALDPRLVSAARAHAAGMAAGGLLSAESPDGVSVYQRVVSAGYAYLTVGEHLVSGPRDPSAFVDYCLSGERSRSTLCDPGFEEAGLARVADARSGEVYWTALWARPFSPAGLERTTREVLALTNRERAAHGLPQLSPDGPLTAAAQGHSADMVARDFYAHTSPDGRAPWDRAAAAGSRHRTVGENIACGQRSPAEVVLGWMNSPGHRANILTPEFTHLGVGLAGGGRAGTYWTQLFGG